MRTKVTIMTIVLGALLTSIGVLVTLLLTLGPWLGLGTGVGLPAIVLMAYFFLVRPRHSRRGATDEEVAPSMPGEELLPGAPSTTRAITIGSDHGWRSQTRKEKEMDMRRLVTLGVVLTLAMITLGGMAPAQAGAGDVRRPGVCTGSSSSKIKLSRQDGRIEVEFEVDQSVVGAKWRVLLKNDGRLFLRGTRTTKAPSGSFEVRRLTSDGAGPDTIVGRARNLTTDEVCRAQATI
jgi:hypothetical protein